MSPARFAPGRQGRARPRAPGRGISLAGLALAAALAGCRGERVDGGRAVTREEFIETYAALLRAEAEAADSAEARSRRAWVLQRRKLSPEDLERFARRHEDDPAYMAAVWGEIEVRIRAAQAPDTTKDGPR